MQGPQEGQFLSMGEFPEIVRNFTYFCLTLLTGHAHVTYNGKELVLAVTKEDSGMLLAEELAEKAGVTGFGVRKLLRKGVLRGYKRRGIWFIPREEAERYLESRKGRERASFGRKKRGK